MGVVNFISDGQAARDLIANRY